MSSPSSPPDDRPRPLVRFDGALAVVENAFNLIAAAAILILMLLAVAQIVGRTVFNQPVFGFIDITEQAMAVFAFGGIAYCQRIGDHIRMEILLGYLKGRALWLAEVMGVVLIWIAVAGLVYGSWLHFERAWSIGDSTIDINIPTWPSKLVVPVAFGLLLLRVTLQIYGYLRLVRNPEASTAGVPVFHNVQETAQHEIEEALGSETTAEETTR